MLSIKNIAINSKRTYIHYNKDFYVEKYPDKLNFFILKTNKSLQLDTNSLYYISHPNSNKLFVLIKNKIINIYKISDSFDKIEKISSINDYSCEINMSSFNPFDENILISNSLFSLNNNT